MVQNDIIDEIIRDIARFENSERRAMIQYYAKQIGKSEKTLYRILKARGNGSGRKRRCDLGERRIDISDEQFLEIVSLIVKSAGKKYKRPKMPLWKAIETAERMGIIEKGILSVGTLNRWMLDHGLAKSQIASNTRYREMQSEHPNHVHQFDTSVCAQWYLQDDNTLKYKKNYKNKNLDKRRCIKRFLLVDHLTGAFFVRYYLDESLGTCLEFLFDAWGNKPKIGDLDYIFRGVPRILYTDNGIWLQSSIGKTVCDNLGIELISHLPEVARATGSVETHQWKWETAFETELMEYPARTLEELNERAYKFALYYNLDRKHTRYGLPRFEAWGKIKKEELRELPENKGVLKALAMSCKVERTIKYNGRINYNGKQYRVNDDRLWGKKVLIGPDIFSKDFGIIVDCEGQKYKVEKLELNEWGYSKHGVKWGDFRGFSDSDTERGLKEMKKILEDGEKRELGEIEYSEGIDNVVGSKIEIGHDPDLDILYDRVQAKKAIADRLGYDLLDWQWRIIDAILDEKDIIRSKDLEEIILRIDGNEAKIG